MTRINLLQPKELHKLHLLAEIRELPRVFSYVEKFGIDANRIPKEFTLNKGHILFFSNKLKFLFERYCILYKEAQNRGYKINYNMGELYQKYSDIIIGENQINWKPSEKDIELSYTRIKEKMELKPELYKND